jgi:hypothetical protein
MGYGQVSLVAARLGLVLLSALPLGASVIAADTDASLDGLIKNLESEEFETREKAQELIVAYFNEHVAEQWAIGKRLTNEKGNDDVSLRIKRILNLIEIIKPISTSDRDACLLDVFPDLNDDKIVDGVPFLIVVITDEEMLRFYKSVIQRNGCRGIPSIDFKQTCLFAIKGKGGGFKYINSVLCQRDFAKRKTHCEVSLHAGRSGIVPSFVFSKTDFPLIIDGTDSSDENSKPARLILIENDASVTWDKREEAIKARNLTAIRFLATTCDEATPAEDRREFLRATCNIDPLTPFIMLRHLSKVCAKQFDADCEYWKTSIPDGAITGLLFRSAIEWVRKTDR